MSIVMKEEVGYDYDLYVKTDLQEFLEGQTRDDIFYFLNEYTLK